MDLLESTVTIESVMMTGRWNCGRMERLAAGMPEQSSGGERIKRESKGDRSIIVLTRRFSLRRLRGSCREPIESRRVEWCFMS